MPLLTVDSLVDHLRGRPLLRPEQFEELTRQHAPAHTDSADLARTLIRLRWLTIYQAKKVLAGRPDDLVVGPYVVLDKLGEGGMGKVYKAVQLSMNRVVALKVVRASLLKSETALKRFMREARSAAKLSHNNIIRVMDADQSGDRHYLAMEYVEGTDLAKWVKDRGALPVTMACSYIRQTALGLQHAHDLGLVHRDVKPSNLLVAVDDKGEYSARNVVKILDMGLARMQQDELAEPLSTELTRTGTVVGTPDFMSPEQAKNSSQVDHRSDLYSLGCAFYYLLAGDVPFPNGSPLEKLLQHQMDFPQSLDQIRNDVPPEVAGVIQTLMAKRPEQRFQSGSAVAHALLSWSTGKGTTGLIRMPVPAAEAAEPLTDTLDNVPTDGPFDFDVDGDISTPLPGRTPPPLPGGRSTQVQERPLWRKAVILAAIFAGFVTLGAIGAAILVSKSRGKDRDESVPVERGDSGGTKEDVKPPTVRPKDEPVVRDLEIVEKYLPDDTQMVALFDIKAWQSAPAANRIVVSRLNSQLEDFATATGIDLMATVDRVVVGIPGEQAAAVILLQGKTLVHGKLMAAIKSLPGVRTEPAWRGGPEIAVLLNKGGKLYAGLGESTVILSSQKSRLVDAIEKRDGSRKTSFADSTLARGIEVMQSRSFAVCATIGLRQDWAKASEPARSLTYAAAGITFEERGMHFHTIADETQAGKAMEFQKQLGTHWTQMARKASPPSLPLHRIADLFTNAQPQPNKLTLIKGRPVQSHYLVPTARLEEWFAPFFKKGDDS